jgi:hypothetical protein
VVATEVLVPQPRSRSIAPLLRIPTLAATLVLLLATAAWAQPAPAPAPAPAPSAPAPPGIPAESWAGQLETLSRWLELHRPAPRCGERCYTLDRLRVTGRVGDGPLKFELTGGVLADGPVAVPLFGPPAHLHVEAATEDGKEAVIGFEGDHYFLYTAARHFVLKGSLTLEGDLALTLPGPLNALLADVTDGAVMEGARLTGLKDATVHFSREGAAQASGPTVFQLSRAVRVGREIGFEYRLVMRSGTDLGVARLPLPFGEKVLDVTGATGWRVEGGELVLPTSGRTAEMTVTGTLAKVGTFAPDARSGYEWWLIESDPEHRIAVGGDAHQLDSAESPIPRTQATSRLFLVQKGQRIEVAVSALVSVDVLAAVVRSHQRTVVLTQRGDLVSDDTLSYENNGIDYLLYAPDGRPIYLATDGKAERIMHQAKDANDVLVPLRTGSHTVRVQALAEAALHPFGGRLALPVSSYPLMASSTRILVGVPAGVLPVALLGGDRPEWLFDGGDLAAVIVAFIVARLAVRVPVDAPRRRARRLRILGGAVLAGLWFVSGALFVAVVALLAAAGLLWIMGRFLRGAKLGLAFALFGFVAFLIFIATLTASKSPSIGSRASYSEPAPAATTTERWGKDATGNFVAQAAVGGVLEGVTPVALNLPSYARSMEATRELVARERPFRPVLFYVTDWALWPLVLLWLGGALALLLAHRGPFAEASRWVRERVLREGATAGVEKVVVEKNEEGGEAARAP